MLNDLMTSPRITESHNDVFMMERLLAEPTTMTTKAEAVEYRLNVLLWWQSGQVITNDIEENLFHRERFGIISAIKA